MPELFRMHIVLNDNHKKNRGCLANSNSQKAIQLHFCENFVVKK